MNGFGIALLFVILAEVSPIYVERHLNSRQWCKKNERELYRRNIGFTCEPISPGRPSRHISRDMANLAAREQPETTAKNNTIPDILLDVQNIAVPNDPCAEFNPPAPDFSAPGRRISEMKCMEYRWREKLRLIKKRLHLYCLSLRTNSFFKFSIGGRQSGIGEYPHMGAIGWKGATKKWIFNCGTTLISSKFTLTAAHCSRAARNSDLAELVPKIVRLGKTYLGEYSLSNNDINIKRFIKHPLYRAEFKYYDIALIELVSHVNFRDSLQPACLWSSMDTAPLGGKATLTGWGATSIDKRGTDDLQAAEVELLENDLCDKLLMRKCNRHWCGVRKHQICAGNLTSRVDSCHGDSGGPLQVKVPAIDHTHRLREGPTFFVIGITSFGIGCARVKTPGIYTRVAPFMDWIEEIVWSTYY